ncbi:MAG: hypothetical protein ABSH03_24085 [Candidatus Lustribacter sp.]
MSATPRSDRRLGRREAGFSPGLVAAFADAEPELSPDAHRQDRDVVARAGPDECCQKQCSRRRCRCKRRVRKSARDPALAFFDVARHFDQPVRKCDQQITSLQFVVVRIEAGASSALPSISSYSD